MNSGLLTSFFVLVNADHPFALDLMKVIYQKYEDLPNEDDKRHLFKTIIYSLNKIISFSIKTTWLWLPVLVSKILAPYWLTN